MDDAREYTLAEVADAAGMTERNVRAYQSRGLLPPSRRQGRRSLYGADHVTRLRLVRSLHQHGLTLRVIADIVERGTADAEMARLGREELSAAVAALRVPMSTAIVEAYQNSNPGGMDALVDANLIERDGDRFVANASSLGIVAALSARGIDVGASAEVSLRAARAANACVPDLRSVVDELAARGVAETDELSMLVIQLASSAFADVLTSHLAPFADEHTG